METGGTRSTSTPIFRFLTKALLPLSDARHITHCAAAEAGTKTPRTAALIKFETERSLALLNMILWVR